MVTCSSCLFLNPEVQFLLVMESWIGKSTLAFT